MKQLDGAGWLITTLHDMLGHNKTAAYLGVDSGDTAECVMCRYDRHEVTKQDVIDRLGVERKG